MTSILRLLHGDDTSMDSMHDSHSSHSASADAANDDMSMGMGGGGSSSFCSGSGTVMMNGFQTSFNGGSCIIYLFEGATVDTQAKYVGAVVATLLMAIAVELLRGLRGSIRAGDFAWSRSLAATKVWALDLVDAAFLGVQMVLAYWLMLLVMTYESVIFAAIIVGIVLGHLVVSRRDRMRAARSAAGAPKEAVLVNEGTMLKGSAALQSGTPCCDYSPAV